MSVCMFQLKQMTLSHRMVGSGRQEEAGSIFLEGPRNGPHAVWDFQLLICKALRTS